MQKILALYSLKYYKKREIEGRRERPEDDDQMQLMSKTKRMAGNMKRRSVW